MRIFKELNQSAHPHSMIWIFTGNSVAVANDSKRLQGTSRKHAYIILTPLTPPLHVYSKTGVYGGINYFSYFCFKTYIVGTC